ncbi:hypothetical protein BSPLISOX_310 [uncultured Gammaproteobacteria bacterium]|jgi:hypothetical protein|nr:hypothetical protein BSPLISOX_310 [uncultured Gammaproteobacteria bacterium]
MPLYNTKMQVERDKLLEQVKKIIKHLRSSGGDFGDSNITNERNIYRSMTQALKDIGKYCDDYDIKITKLDSIKLLVFALPYIKERDLAMNSERYIFSIFKMLGEATNNKQINSNEQIRKSIAVCDKLFNNGNNLVVYGYIKGFQEALEYTKDK